jgi:hypothetical protein
VLYRDQGTNMSPLGTYVASANVDVWVTFGYTEAS